MKKEILCGLVLTGIACTKAPPEVTGPEALVVTNVAVAVNGKEIKVPLPAPEKITNLSEVLGACVTKDLKQAKILRIGEVCPDEWIAVVGRGPKK